MKNIGYFAVCCNWRLKNIYRFELKNIDKLVCDNWTSRNSKIYRKIGAIWTVVFQESKNW